jgi:hypothetical protein
MLQLYMKVAKRVVGDHAITPHSDTSAKCYRIMTTLVVILRQPKWLAGDSD